MSISRDAIEFVVAAECMDAANEIAKNIISFAENNPSEDEVLSRCRHVFEVILKFALSNDQSIDLSRFDVEIQLE